MIIKILTKRPNGNKLRGVGLGNQIWMLPAILKLAEDNEVITDSELLSSLSENIILSEQNADIFVFPAYCDWQDIWMWRLKKPSIQFWGFKYKVKGRHIGIGLNKSVKIDMGLSELENVRKLIPFQKDFLLPREEKNIIKKSVVLGTSKKDKCYYPYWDNLKEMLVELGYQVTVLGELGYMVPFKKLISIIKENEFFIGVDSGLMHIADIFNLKGFVFWKDTPFMKNAPIHFPCLRIDTIPSKNLIRRYLK